jgi:hypothetical protein
MKLECLVLLTWFPFAESGIFGFHVRKPLSGFLGDRPEMPKIAQFDQDDFQALYKKPRADPRTTATKTEQIEVKENNDNSTILIEQITIKNKDSEVSSGFKNMTVEKDTHAASMKNASGMPERKPRRKPTTREEKLIESLKGMEGDAAVGCVTHCRYGEEVRHTWQECLTRCVENGPMRSIMESMLPPEDHGARALHAEVPSSLQDHLKRHRERSEEL